MTRGLFLSDLHLFSRRSVGQSHWEQHRDAISTADAIVLGGDIFDIRWSQFGSLSATLTEAEAWLDAAITLNPSARWMYLLGNHDCHPRIQSMLRTLAERYSNFSWRSDLFQMGDNLFLHGDVLDGHGKAGGLEAYRKAFHEEKPRGEIGNLLYSAVIRTRLHGAIPRLRHTQQKTCRRLVEYLESHHQESLASVRNIFFGHTHVPMSHYQFDRFLFHNAGSGIRHLAFTPATFEVFHADD
jgi:UDP-2,3-diacylglucosamine hydrolase